MKDWFIRGYDDYMPPPGRSRSPGSVINSIGLPWISEHKDRDFFLFLHFWDAHIPYVPPSPFKERYTHGTAGRIDPDITAKLEGRPSYPLFKQNLYDFLDAMPNLDYIADLYDAEVAYLDFEIGRIFHHLESEGLLEDTMVVLFGDHGENMTEHDAWFDHAGLYDSVTHVPLLMWAPGTVPVCESTAMVTLIDVMPTILETLGLPEAEGIDGRSLLPADAGRDHRPPRRGDAERGHLAGRPGACAPPSGSTSSSCSPPSTDVTASSSTTWPTTPTSSTTWPTSTPRWSPTSATGSTTGSRPSWPGGPTRCTR